MALFAVNTGLRDENICGLQWSWERYIPDLKRSVFVIPPEVFKSNRSHVVILNDVAAKVIEACRDIHPEFVFTYKKQVKNKKLKEHEPDRVGTINSNAWQKARKRAGLEQVRVHDLRHTFGQRLRDAGVLSEDRAALMGHAVNNMSEHYATPTIARLIEMANLAPQTRDTPRLLRVSTNSRAKKKDLEDFSSKSLILQLKYGRSTRIRTLDPLVPNQVRYRAALHSEKQDNKQYSDFCQIFIQENF